MFFFWGGEGEGWLIFCQEHHALAGMSLDALHPNVKGTVLREGSGFLYHAWFYAWLGARAGI